MKDKIYKSFEEWIRSRFVRSEPSPRQAWNARNAEVEKLKEKIKMARETIEYFKSNTNMGCFDCADLADITLKELGERE